MKNLAIFVFGLLLHASTVRADLSVSPVALYLGDDKPTGRIVVENRGTDAREIEVQLEYGYPVSDDDGNVSFRFVDALESHEPSGLSWTSIYPRRFSLGPKESQAIVVMTKAPSTLPDGEYWVRPVIVSRPGGMVASVLNDANRVQSIVLSMNYRRGMAATGIRIEDVMVNRSDKTLRLVSNLSPEGNAAFLGNIVCRLFDLDQSLLTEVSQEIAVYRPMRKGLEIEIPSLPAGSYTVEVEMNTYRQGNNAGDILQTRPVIRRTVYEHEGSGAEPNLAKMPMARKSENPAIELNRGRISQTTTTATARNESTMKQHTDGQWSETEAELRERIAQLEKALTELMAAQTKFVGALAEVRK